MSESHPAGPENQPQTQISCRGTIVRLLLAAGILITAIGLGLGSGKWEWLFKGQVAAMVLLASLAALLISQRGRQWGLALHGVVRPDDLAKEPAQEAAAFWDAASAAFIASGVLAMLLGTVAMLRQLDDPKGLGDGIGTSFIGLVYGVVLSEFICQPIRRRIQAQVHAPDGAGRQGLSRLLGAGLAVLAVISSVMTILFVFAGRHAR